jgi:hypothetical protein
MFACLIIVAVFPLLASLTHNKSDNPVPFAAVAFAGHTTPGGEYCDCGTSNCICDPGERPGGQSNRTAPIKTDDSLNPAAYPASKSPGFDFGSGALMLALAFLVWTRLRA